MYGNLWETVENVDLRTKNTSSISDISVMKNNDEWLAAISPQSYLSYVKQPFFTCVGTNSPNTDMDRTYECLSRMDNGENAMVLFAPRAMDSLLSTYMKNLIKWFASQLMPSEGKFDVRDVKIKISAKLTNGDVKIVTQYKCPNFSSLNLYYCRDKQGLNGTRNWVKQTMKRNDEEEYVCVLKLYDASTPVIAFCNVTFPNGVTVSSNLLKFIPQKKFVGEVINLQSRSPVVYSGDQGVAEFTPMTPMGDQKGEFVDDNPVSQTVGPFEICGLCGTRMGSFVVGDDCILVGENSLLMMDVCSKEAQDMTVYFVTDWGEDSVTAFKHTCRLEGGANWQKIVLSNDDFKNEGRAKGLNFADASVICFECKNVVVINNIIFT